MNGTDNKCYVDTSAADIVTTTTSKMEYNNDGESYIHNFTINKAGPISIFIHVYEASYIKAIYYTNIYFNTTPTEERWSNLLFTNTSNSHLAGGITDRFSYTLYTYIIGPTTGTVDFYIEFDDGMQIQIDGNIQQFLIIGAGLTSGNLNGQGVWAATFSLDMTQDHYYLFQIKWNNAGGSGAW